MFRFRFAVIGSDCSEIVQVSCDGTQRMKVNAPLLNQLDLLKRVKTALAL